MKKWINIYYIHVLYRTVKETNLIKYQLKYEPEAIESL